MYLERLIKYVDVLSRINNLKTQEFLIYESTKQIFRLRATLRMRTHQK